MKKLGYFYSTILVNIQNISKENEEKIKNFAEKSELIRSIVLSMSKPNCFVQLFHKEHQDLIDEINNLKELFKDDIVDIDVLFMDSEFKINTLPFL